MLVWSPPASIRPSAVHTPGSALQCVVARTSEAHVYVSARLHLEPPTRVVSLLESPGPHEMAAAHVEEVALHRPIAEPRRLFAQHELDLERCLPVMLFGHVAELRRQRHALHGCRYRFGERLVVDAHSVWLAAFAHRKADLDPPSVRWCHADAPSLVASRCQSRGCTHRASLDLEQGALHGLVAEPRYLGVEVQVELELCALVVRGYVREPCARSLRRGRQYWCGLDHGSVVIEHGFDLGLRAVHLSAVSLHAVRG